MIDRLKYQQNKLVANERHEAWESVARKIVYQAFEIIEERTGETGVEIFRAALQNSIRRLWRVVIAFLLILTSQAPWLAPSMVALK